MKLAYNSALSTVSDASNGRPGTGEAVRPDIVSSVESGFGVKELKSVSTSEAAFWVSESLADL